MGERYTTYLSSVPYIKQYSASYFYINIYIHRERSHLCRVCGNLWFLQFSAFFQGCGLARKTV